jgi:ABC-2 type transport system ATP-binding protein
MTAAVSFRDVGKTYRAESYRSLRNELWRGGRATARPALHDLTFDVDAGDALGIIGPNGAGKSTALRLAARITAATSGSITVRGRLGALIDVGAGIHPELTGRENIWLYGAIVGLRRAEIARHFDDIVSFAELEAVLDRQVKHYSSGMQLRLGFAVAAGVRPDVLVIDEALAVGDARFQLRCVERMRELVHSGTTVLLVSHDLPTIDAVCARALLLVDGTAAALGPTASTLEAYTRWIHTSDDRDGSLLRCPPLGTLAFDVPLPADRTAPVNVAIGVRDGHPWNLLGGHVRLPTGYPRDRVRCTLEDLPLEPGRYEVWAAVDGVDGGDWQQLATLRVDGPVEMRPLWQPPVRFRHHWDL